MFDVVDQEAPLGPSEDLSAQAEKLAATRSSGSSDADPSIIAADELHAMLGSIMRSLFSALREIDRTRAWEDDGARDLAHWVQMRYGISMWKAHRWVEAARAIEQLPGVAEALASGGLGCDKVVELTRFATPGTERGLVAWASTVSTGAIRRRAEIESRRSLEAAVAPERERRLRWWLTDEGRRLELMAELPATDGALVAGAIERIAATLPDLPELSEDERAHNAEARRADALVALCTSSSPGSSGRRRQAPRPRIVVHASLASLRSPSAADLNAGTAHGSFHAVELEVDGVPSLAGGVIDPPTFGRLLCDADLQLVTEDDDGEPLRLGRSVREPSATLARTVRARDRECRFPACGGRLHTEAHHVVWWSRGGRTDVDNLVLLCGFHHRLVHEHGWGLRRGRDGNVAWTRPDGRRYRAGPSPPR